MTDVKALLEKLENDEHIGHETIAKLKKNGYVMATILYDNNITIAFATYTGLTEKGKRVLNNEN